MKLRAFVRRHRGPLLAIAVVVVVLGAFGLYWFQPWKLFTRSTVQEAVPSAAAAVAVVSPQASPSVPPPTTVPSTTVPSTVPSTVPIAVSPTSTEAQVPPTAAVEALAPVVATEPVVLAVGSFVSGEHETAGTASVLQLADGSRFVRLEDFSTSDGPDVHVWLSDQPAGGDWYSFDDGRHLEIGSLKATDGSQNYAIPADAELAGFTSVVIWCERFSVAFGSAPVAL